MRRTASSRIAFALAALALAAPTSRAEEISYQLTGKVTAIHPDEQAPLAVGALAAHGVVVGADVSILLVVDDAVAGGWGEPYTWYPASVVEMVVGIGTWQAFRDITFTGPISCLTLVTAGDVGVDSYSATCPGFDTDLITSKPAQFSTLNLVFTDIEGDAATNDGLAQDLEAYSTTRVGDVTGPDCQVVFSIDDGSIAPPVPTHSALARSGQLKAGAVLASSVLKGLGKIVAKPQDDTTEAAKSALLTEAGDTFADQFLKAITKADKQGGTAPLGVADENQVTAKLVVSVMSQSFEALSALDAGDPADRALRSKVHKALAVLNKAHFLALAKDVKKPDTETLNERMAKAQAAFDKKFQKALVKATAQGVIYSGASALQLIELAAEVAFEFSELTGAGLPEP